MWDFGVFSFLKGFIWWNTLHRIFLKMSVSPARESYFGLFAPVVKKCVMVKTKMFVTCFDCSGRVSKNTHLHTCWSNWRFWRYFLYTIPFMSHSFLKTGVLLARESHFGVFMHAVRHMWFWKDDGRFAKPGSLESRVTKMSRTLKKKVT